MIVGAYPSPSAEKSTGSRKLSKVTTTVDGQGGTTLTVQMDGDIIDDAAWVDSNVAGTQAQVTGITDDEATVEVGAADTEVTVFAVVE